MKFSFLSFFFNLFFCREIRKPQQIKIQRWSTRLKKFQSKTFLIGKMDEIDVEVADYEDFTEQAKSVLLGTQAFHGVQHMH